MDPLLLALEGGRGPGAEGCGRPLKAGKGKGMGSALETSEGNAPRPNLDFRPVRPVMNF